MARSRVRGNQAPSNAEFPSPAPARRLTRTSIPPRNPASRAVRVLAVISARPPFLASTGARTDDPDGNVRRGQGAVGAGGTGRVAVPRPVVTTRARPTTTETS